MDTSDENSGPGEKHRNSQINSTDWSLVVAAGDSASPRSQAALTELCRAYWFPVYCYLRRSGNSADDASDLTQEFMAYLLENKLVQRADCQRGRFRNFLLASVRHFVANQYRNKRSQRRGGGHQPLSLECRTAESKYEIQVAHHETPERVFERQWVLTLLDSIINNLQLEFAAAGESEKFELLKEGLNTSLAQDDYARVAASLGTTAAAAKQAVYRLRHRFQQAFRVEIARTVSSMDDVEAEIARLWQILVE